MKRVLTTNKQVIKKKHLKKTSVGGCGGRVAVAVGVGVGVSVTGCGCGVGVGGVVVGDGGDDGDGERCAAYWRR